MAQTLPVPITDAPADEAEQSATAPATKRKGELVDARFERHGPNDESGQPAKPKAPRVALAAPRVVLSLPHDPVPEPNPANEDCVKDREEATAVARQSSKASSGSVDEVKKFLTHMRRVWMSAPFKRQPHTILTVKVCPAGAEADDGRSAQPTARALHKALSELAQPFWVAPDTLGMLLPGKSVRMAARIAEAVQKALDAQAVDAGPRVRLVAGVAALHRDDDPVSAYLLAERCLERGARRGCAAVVTEADLRAAKQSQEGST
ncbi:MAG: hypothetical protein AAGF45_03360 [Pseudomonadota bacterium]